MQLTNGRHQFRLGRFKTCLSLSKLGLLLLKKLIFMFPKLIRTIAFKPTFPLERERLVLLLMSCRFFSFLIASIITCFSLAMVASSSERPLLSVPPRDTFDSTYAEEHESHDVQDFKILVLNNKSKIERRLSAFKKNIVTLSIVRVPHWLHRALFGS